MNILSKITWIRWLFRDPLPVDHQDLVLDVGCGGNPHPRADVLCDKFIEDSQRPSTLRVDDRPFILADAEKLPFRDKSFDFVVSRHIIEHIREPERFLNESMRISRKGGLITAPSSTWEKFFPFRYHLWLIKVENNQLVFVRKEREIFDEELSQFFHTYRGPLRYIVDQIWTQLHRDALEVRFLWQNKIRYQIHRANNITQEKKKNNPVQGIKGFPKVKINYRSFLLTRLRRALYGRRKFNYETLLVCPFCKSNLKKKSKSFYCVNCHYHFPIIKGIPMLLNNRTH